MLLNVSLTNTNNHGEKQAEASSLVVSINQCESDVWWLQFVNAGVIGLFQIEHHSLSFRRNKKKESHNETVTPQLNEFNVNT